MYQKQKLHAGLQLVCKVCTPDQKPKRRRRDDRPKVERVTTLDGTLRRQLAEEIGEDELSKEHRFAVLQKFGLTAVRIDRKVTKPNWIGEKQWNQQLNAWYTATKGLVPTSQTKRIFVRTATARPVPGNMKTKPSWSKITHKRFQSPSNPAGIKGVKEFEMRQQKFSKPQGSTPPNQ